MYMWSGRDVCNCCVGVLSCCVCRVPVSCTVLASKAPHGGFAAGLRGLGTLLGEDRARPAPLNSVISVPGQTGSPPGCPGPSASCINVHIACQWMRPCLPPALSPLYIYPPCTTACSLVLRSYPSVLTTSTAPYRLCSSLQLAMNQPHTSPVPALVFVCMCLCVRVFAVQWERTPPHSRSCRLYPPLSLFTTLSPLYDIVPAARVLTNTNSIFC